jgi:hypothetical protein
MTAGQTRGERESGGCTECPPEARKDARGEADDDDDRWRTMKWKKIVSPIARLHPAHEQDYE